LYNTLYFSSSGQLFNFGQIDIYKTKRINNQWTEPKNVGPLINGKGREKYFTIDKSSQFLFYAKAKERHANLDLHSFPLPMEAKPNTVTFSGKVFEKATGETFEGIVAMIDLDDHVEIAPKYLRENGSFEFELENHKNYLLVIDGDNFFRIEEMFYLNGSKDVTIPAVNLNTAITFEAIDFDKNSSKLKPEMENNLHTIINFLLIHPNFTLTITGHTDLDGDPDKNVQLSQKRAEVIKKYLVSYGGLDASRITVDGVGSSQPIIEKEITETHKRLNRRVEFKISKVNDDSILEDDALDDSFNDEDGEW
jgi:outer membrane protein OmpA-like peptidoglycan-associated protein